MDMFRARPLARPDGGLAGASPPPPRRGVCYLAPQSVLVFGQDRRAPVASRSVVSVKSMGQVHYVLPATSKPRPDFYRLAPERCRARVGYRGLGASWLAPWPEPVLASVLTRIGTLPDDEWASITDWLRQRGAVSPALVSEVRR